MRVDESRRQLRENIERNKKELERVDNLLTQAKQRITQLNKELIALWIKDVMLLASTPQDGSSIQAIEKATLVLFKNSRISSKEQRHRSSPGAGQALHPSTSSSRPEVS